MLKQQAQKQRESKRRRQKGRDIRIKAKRQRESNRRGQKSREPEKREEDMMKRGLKSDERGGDINIENGGENDIKTQEGKKKTMARRFLRKIRKG